MDGKLLLDVVYDQIVAKMDELVKGLVPTERIGRLAARNTELGLKWTYMDIIGGRNLVNYERG